MFIDTHTHVFTREGPFATDARYRPDYDAALTALQGQWRERGVTHGVLVQPSFYGIDNSKLFAALAADPERLRGVVVIDPSVPVAKLKAWHALGVRGIRLNLVGVRDVAVFAADGWLRVYRDIASLGWHVEVQPENGALPRVLDALAACPATIVVDHFGRPDAAQGLRCPTFAALRSFAARHAVYVKLSAAYRNEPADCAPYSHWLLLELGPERLMWGSDWPWTGFERRGFGFADKVAALSQWVPDAAARRVVQWDTPAKVFGFDVA